MKHAEITITDFLIKNTPKELRSKLGEVLLRAEQPITTKNLGLHGNRGSSVVKLPGCHCLPKIKTLKCRRVVIRSFIIYYTIRMILSYIAVIFVSFFSLRSPASTSFQITCANT